MKSLIVAVVMLFVSVGSWSQDNAPNMGELSSVGKVLKSIQEGFATDLGWRNETMLMGDLGVFDRQAMRMLKTICSRETNKSVLLVGPPNDTYRYLFARLSMMPETALCAQMSHVEVVPSKLQGYMYSGTTDRLWRDKIERAAYDKDVVLYFNNLANLIGIGTHSNQDTGIESRYADALRSGKLKSVAFVNHFDYNRLSRSRHAYVLNAFKEKIFLDKVTMAQVDQMVRRYFDITVPDLGYQRDDMDYMYRMVEFYQPNKLEPQRTMEVAMAMIRRMKRNVKTLPEVWETPNPYPNDQTIEWEYENKEAMAIALNFEYFETEARHDQLKVMDSEGNILAKYDGNKGEFSTPFFDVSKLKLEFKSDASNNKMGFKLKNIDVLLPSEKIVSKESIRRAILDVAQVPEWMMTRDYSLVRNLGTLLDGDVVGVHDGKRAVIKQVKIGYVSGRTDEKPAGSLLFVGPTGTGKSYIAKKVAEFMEMPLVTMDMTQYSTPDSFDRFLDVLSRALTLNPYAFYLFEEIDKANSKVLDRLFFMMDEGVFYDRNQTPLFARGAFVMMTTNAGHQLIIRERDNPNLRRLVNQELQNHYRPSFLNRFDAISIFTPFTDSEFLQLATIMTSKKIKKMKQYFDWDVTVDESIIEYMSVHGRSELYGARPMERTVENVLSVGVSEYQITQASIPFGSKVHFQKILGQPHGMRIIVNDEMAMEYSADPQNNSGGLYMALQGHFLQSIF